MLILRLVRDSHPMLHSIYVPEKTGPFPGRTPTGMAWSCLGMVETEAGQGRQGIHIFTHNVEKNTMRSGNTRIQGYGIGMARPMAPRPLSPDCGLNGTPRSRRKGWCGG